MPRNFSDKYLAGLKPKTKMYLIRETKGFVIQVAPTGRKTFLYIYQADGKRKQINLGMYPAVSLSAARRKYAEAAEAVYRGEPVPVNEPEPPPSPEPGTSKVTTVKDLYLKYMADSRKDHVEAWADIKESIYKNKITPWHHRGIKSITKDEAIDFIDRERLNGDGAMRNSYKALHALFQYAEDRSYIETNPFYRMKKIKASLKNKERSRFLTEEEIPVVWRGIEEGIGTSITKRALKLILVTAQRPGEVVGMHRSEISGDWWTIPAVRAQKGSGDHRVFLTKTAKELIGDGEGFIFPTPMHGKSGHIHKVSLSQCVANSECYGVPHWTPHDLRRTARTHFSRLRVRREHAEAVLNHAKAGMVKIYDQYEFDDEKKEALQAWEAELLRLVNKAC